MKFLSIALTGVGVNHLDSLTMALFLCTTSSGNGFRGSRGEVQKCYAATEAHGVSSELGFGRRRR